MNENQEGDFLSWGQKFDVLQLIGVVFLGTANVFGAGLYTLITLAIDESVDRAKSDAPRSTFTHGIDIRTHG